MKRELPDDIHLTPPELLAAHHKLDDFSCGELSLDEWLVERALANQVNGASRTYTVLDSNNHVQGYYALATGAVSRQAATPAVRRNMPEPIPVIVLARLAVNYKVQGRKVGAALLQDAMRRAAMVSEHVGVRAMLVHALHDRAKAFYEQYGFRTSPIQPLTLMQALPRS